MKKIGVRCGKEMDVDSDNHISFDSDSCISVFLP